MFRWLLLFWCWVVVLGGCGGGGCAGEELQRLLGLHQQPILPRRRPWMVRDHKEGRVWILGCFKQKKTQKKWGWAYFLLLSMAIRTQFEDKVEGPSSSEVICSSACATTRSSPLLWPPATRFGTFGGDVTTALSKLALLGLIKASPFQIQQFSIEHSPWDASGPPHGRWSLRFAAPPTESKRPWTCGCWTLRAWLPQLQWWQHRHVRWWEVTWMAKDRRVGMRCLKMAQKTTTSTMHNRLNYYTL